MAKHEESRGEDTQRSGNTNDTTRTNSDHQNTAPSSGGRADMGNEQIRSASGGSTTGGSGIATKKSITGSDYDGQVSEGN